MKERFLSKITPRNFYWSTTGIYDPSGFKFGLLCIFFLVGKNAQTEFWFGDRKAVYHY